MKIAIFTDSYYPDISGLTIALESLVASLRRKGHTVYLFTPKVRGYEGEDKDTYRITSVKVLSSEPAVRVPLLLPNKTLQKMFSLDFDLVHAHGNGAFSLLGYQVARLKNIPYILTFHSIHTKYTHYFFEGKIVKPRLVATGLRLFANLCDGVIVPSEKMGQELRNYGFPGQIKVIPNFIDFKKFAQVKKGYLHKKLKLPPEVPILLSVGRLGLEKNFDFLLRAFSKIAKSNKEAHLVIAGQGPEKANFKKLSKELGVGDRVHFTGKLDTRAMPAVYADATIFVFASDTETQGMVVLEAAVSGLPLVVVEDAAFKNIAINEFNGFSIPPDEKIFAEKVNLLLEDSNLREKFAENSRKLANQNFDPDKLTREMLKAYQEVTKKHKTKKRILRRIINREVFIKFLKVIEGFNKLVRSGND